MLFVAILDGGWSCLWLYLMVVVMAMLVMIGNGCDKFHSGKI